MPRNFEADALVYARYIETTEAGQPDEDTADRLDRLGFLDFAVTQQGLLALLDGIEETVRDDARCGDTLPCSEFDVWQARQEAALGWLNAVRSIMETPRQRMAA